MHAKGDSVLIVGAGPAGLEAARALGLNGYQMAIAEAGTELGGRLARECRLPGFSAWARVRDQREGEACNKCRGKASRRLSGRPKADVRDMEELNELLKATSGHCQP
jgi:monoamine oxidase